jgi:hypothetical protein
MIASSGWLDRRRPTLGAPCRLACAAAGGSCLVGQIRGFFPDAIWFVRPEVLQNRMRLKSNFLNRFNAIPAVQLTAKNISLRRTPKVESSFISEFQKFT